MHINRTHLVQSGKTELLPKSSIYEAELRDRSVQALTPLCSAVQRDEALLSTLSKMLPLDLDDQAIKLQVNNGGCFPIHFDTDEGLDSRRITAIYYLNPHWGPSHGGQLRLYPWPRAEVTVDPLNDRLVLFSSTRMLHRVMPSSGKRVCFTIWISGGTHQGDAAAAERRREASALLASASRLSPSSALRLLCSPDVRPHAARLALAPTWAQSLVESHPPGKRRDALLAKFVNEVSIIERALGPAVASAKLYEGIDGESWQDRVSSVYIPWF